MAKSIDPSCAAFQAAIDVLGRPWTALILSLLLPGPLRFNELAGRAEGLSDKVLSARLKSLEADGLVARDVDPGPPVRVTYALTRAGAAFGQVATAIEKWGQTLVPAAPKPRARPRR